MHSVAHTHINSETNETILFVRLKTFICSSKEVDNLLYYKTLGNLQIRRMFSELIVRSTPYHVSLDLAYQGEGY